MEVIIVWGMIFTIIFRVNIGAYKLTFSIISSHEIVIVLVNRLLFCKVVRISA
jgi:hypothetical protein